MATESRERKCSKCGELLVNDRGVHLGIPFGKWYQIDNWWTKKDRTKEKIVCAKCYDEITVDSMYVQQRTGEETI